MPLLTNDDWRHRFARHVDTANQEFSFQLIAFVFMPEHVHLLVYPTLSDPQLSLYLARVKQPSSAEIHAHLESCRSPLLRTLTVRERPGKECFRYWQEGSG